MQPHTALASEVSFRLEEKAAHSFARLILYQQVVSIADAWTCAVSSHFLFLAHGLQSECWGKKWIQDWISFLLHFGSETLRGKKKKKSLLNYTENIIFWLRLVIPVCLKTLISQIKLFRLFQNESWNLLNICLASRFVGDKWFQGQFINASKWRQMLTSRGRIM